MNDENLIPMNRRTKSEQRAIAEKGGKASGKARRDKRDQRAVILEIMSLPLSDGNVDRLKALANAENSNMSVNTAIVIAQVRKALEGDVKAAEYLRDTAGWKPADRVQLDNDVKIDDSIRSIDSYLRGKEKHEDEISGSDI